jgi:hypothetical protein
MGERAVRTHDPGSVHARSGPLAKLKTGPVSGVYGS